MAEQCVTEDGKVMKVVLREGSGSLPPLHARCLGAPRMHCGASDAGSSSRAPRQEVQVH